MDTHLQKGFSVIYNILLIFHVNANRFLEGVVVPISKTSAVFAFKQNPIYLSRVVRKPASCICENKDADKLRGNCEADQRLCFRYTDSTIPLFPKSEI